MILAEGASRKGASAEPAIEHIDARSDGVEVGDLEAVGVLGGDPETGGSRHAPGAERLRRIRPVAGHDDLPGACHGGGTVDGQEDRFVPEPLEACPGIEFRVDRQANLHFIIGKTTFSDVQLVENYAAAIDEVLRLKPSSAKGRYVKKATVTTTMGPGIPVDPNKTRNLLEDQPA